MILCGTDCALQTCSSLQVLILLSREAEEVLVLYYKPRWTRSNNLLWSRSWKHDHRATFSVSAPDSSMCNNPLDQDVYRLLRESWMQVLMLSKKTWLGDWTRDRLPAEKQCVTYDRSLKICIKTLFYNYNYEQFNSDLNLNHVYYSNLCTLVLALA